MGMAPDSPRRSGGVAHARGLRTTLAFGLLVLGAGDLTAIATIFLPRYLASRPQPAPAWMVVPTPTAPSALDTATAMDTGTTERVRPPATPTPELAEQVEPVEPVQVARQPAPAEVSPPPSWPRILFPQNSAWLSPQARATLEELSEYLKQHPSDKVVLEGHTDNLGEPDVNSWLSRNRALRAQQWLVAQGIDPAQIEIHSFGAARPLVPNRSPQARAQNRRVDITVRERIH